MPRATHKREHLAMALASGANVKEAAASARVGERTAHRWLKDDAEFRQRVAEAREQIWLRAVGSLADAASEAVETLRELLGSNSAMARLGAARAILEAGPRLRELVEIESRLLALEARSNATGK
jgi:hypothetical protein